MFSKTLIPALVSIVLLSGLNVQAKSISRPIDPLLKATESWKMTVDEFEKTFTEEGNKLFVWLTLDRTRAKLTRKLYGNAEIDLTAFDGQVPVQEVIVDFADGKLNLISISIYNRADSGAITTEQFAERFKIAGKVVGETLIAKPQRRTADAKNGLLTEGYSWNSRETGVALLEHNEGALEKAEREFLRLRIARPNATGPLAASMIHTRGGAAAKLGDLPKNVKKETNGDVIILNMPMVDQGDKGYCVVATVQRVFEYYGIGADMHQIAQISEADPNRGTSTLTMAKELDKIDYRFKTRLDIIGMGQPLTEVEEKKGEYYVGKPVDDHKFFKEMRTYIDSGLPLLWSLELGRYPEVPQLSPQTAGGHMRLIVGYNDKTEEVIFSDSWGARHEAKRMKMSDAYKASHGLFVLKPTVR
ncbi:MAG: C39 family peptidase [Verrucomicrobiota bacterium]